MQQEKNKLSDQEIDTILNGDLDENFWLFQLGIGTSETPLELDNHFSFPFLNNGKAYWSSIKDKIREVLCDTTKNEPKEVMSDILTGDVRNVIIYCAGLIVQHFDFTAGVTIPLTALVLKKGLHNFCATT